MTTKENRSFEETLQEELERLSKALNLRPSEEACVKAFVERAIQTKEDEIRKNL